MGTRFEDLAPALAEVSKDTPLVTVVGGRLIAREQIRPELLANIKISPRRFEKFAEECEGDLPTGGRSRRELLQLIAAVQPVIEQDDKFAERAAVFMALQFPIRFGKGLDDALETRGVLLRGRGGARNSSRPTFLEIFCLNRPPSTITALRLDLLMPSSSHLKGRISRIC